jgi:hypothetical protein
MGADAQDLISKILLAQAQAKQNQPSFMGLQAPQDPNALTPLLGQLRQQQVLEQANAPTPGQYGYLHDAGRAAFNSIGSNLGGQLVALGNAPQAAPQSQGPAFTPAPSADDSGNPAAANGNVVPPVPNPGATPQQSVGNMILAAKAYYSAQVQRGIDPDQAKVTTAQALVKWGAPNADEILDKANQQLLTNSKTRAETEKDTSQGKMDAANIANQADEQKNRAFTQGSGTWKTTYTDPNGLFMLQTNSNGETKRVELKPPPSAAAQAAANMDPASIQFAADTYRTTGKFPGSFGRSPAMQQAVLAQVAKDALANGDTAGSIAARSASLKAGGVALDQIQKQESFTGSAVNTLDKNLTALQTIGSKIDDTGSPLANKVLNHFNQGVVTDPNTAAYVAMLNAVQGEYAKIASNNNGNSPISDSAKADAKEVINKAMSQGGVAAVRQAMMQEAQNRMQAIGEAKQGLISTLSGNAPGAPQGKQPVVATSPTITPTPQPNAKRVYNPITGTFQ